MEIVLNNTVNKTVIEFNYFIHNYLDTGNLANDKESLLYSQAKIMRDNAQYKTIVLNIKLIATELFSPSFK